MESFEHWRKARGLSYDVMTDVERTEVENEWKNDGMISIEESKRLVDAAVQAELARQSAVHADAAERKCENCVYFDSPHHLLGNDEKGVVGDCRFNAPVYAPENHYNHEHIREWHSFFPSTSSEAICGQFLKKHKIRCFCLKNRRYQCESAVNY